jgi:hypothetical protein
LLICLALGGCAPLTIYYQQGVPVQRLSDDELRCEINALREAPIANQTRQDPPVFVPARRVCDSAGACTTYAAYWKPGRITTVDVNRELRVRLERSCMADRGYARVSIPRCDPGISVIGRTTVLPPLTSRSCAVRNDDGSFAIVNGPS